MEQLCLMKLSNVNLLPRMNALGGCALQLCCLYRVFLSLPYYDKI